VYECLTHATQLQLPGHSAFGSRRDKWGEGAEFLRPKKPGAFFLEIKKSRSIITLTKHPRLDIKNAWGFTFNRHPSSYLNQK